MYKELIAQLISPQLLINYKRKNSNYTVEKLGNTLTKSSQLTSLSGANRHDVTSNVIT